MFEWREMFIKKKKKEWRELRGEERKGFNQTVTNLLLVQRALFSQHH